MTDIYDGDNGEATDPPEQEVEWEPADQDEERELLARNGILEIDFGRGKDRQTERKGSLNEALISLALLTMVISIAICGALSSPLVFELLALTIMICVPAAGAVMFMAYRDSISKK